MVIPENVRLQWYEALSREDSLNVMALLTGHPELLEVGWGSEVLESPGQDQERKKRTALHVGVKRGNVKLVEEVLFLCNVEAVVDKRLKSMKDLDGEDPPSRNWRDLIDWAEIDEAHKNEEITGGPSQKDTRSEGDRQPTGTRPHKAVLGRHLEPAQESSSSNSSPDKERPQRSPSTGDGRATEKISSTGGLRETRSSISLVTDPNDNAFLRRLLMFKDGEYSLDAIAIAALHGNREIFLLLLQAMAKTKFYDVDMSGPPPHDVNRDNEKNSSQRAKLREATEKVVYDWGHRAKVTEATGNIVYASKLSGFADKRVVVRGLEEYEKHLDFNFLPWEEYLFHFLFTGAGLSGLDLAKALWQAVMWYSDSTWYSDLTRHSDSTWRYLLELQDGQGRTPLHVAVDEDRVRDFEKCIFRYFEGQKEIVECEEEIVECEEEIVQYEKEVVEYAMAAQDGAGRTSLHRGMATGACKLGSGKMELVPLVHGIWQHSIPSAYHNWTQSKFPAGTLSSKNGFKGLFPLLEPPKPDPQHIGRNERLNKRTFLRAKEEALRNVQSNPLCSAILHRQFNVVQSTVRCAVESLHTEEWNVTMLVDKNGMKYRNEMHLQRNRSEMGKALGLNLVFPYAWEQGDEGRWQMDSRKERGDTGPWEKDLDPVELAALLGDVSIVEALPLAGYNSNSKSRTDNYRPWPALHIAANAGNYEMLKLFLDDPLCDPHEEDWQGNNAVHHALNVVTIGQFHTHLLDYVSCEHIQMQRSDSGEMGTAGDDPIIERQECINLLLEVGCDVLKKNQDGQPPYPKGALRKNSKFRSWWFKKRRKELEATQTTLRSGANAIALTATLVATASYVGPLQPPMGFGGDPAQIQDANPWVTTFIFCDTMSFYLALVSVILSLVPLLPLAEQDIKDEVRRTQGMVSMSLTFLLPSVIYVLVAFMASSIAVVSADVTSAAGSLTITSASIGGLYCLVTLIIFFVRQVLASFVFRRHKWARRFQKILDKYVFPGHLLTLSVFFVRQLLAAMFPRHMWTRRFHKILDKCIVFG